ncbi:MAG: hypothetical protein ABIA59_07860 [Candidatus Latescibacterota bacterium]
MLAALARHAKRDAELRKACIEAAKTIDSDSEYCRVMKELR